MRFSQLRNMTGLAAVVLATAPMNVQAGYNPPRPKKVKPAKTAPPSEVAANPAAALESNRDLDRMLEAAYAKRDADALMQLYWHSPDLVVIMGDGTKVKGWDNVRQAFASQFATLEKVEAALNEVQYTTTGDSVLSTGKGRLTITPKGGAAVSLDILYTDVRQKVNGNWAIVQDHMRATPAPKAP